MNTSEKNERISSQKKLFIFLSALLFFLAFMQWEEYRSFHGRGLETKMTGKIESVDTHYEINRMGFSRYHQIEAFIQFRNLTKPKNETFKLHYSHDMDFNSKIQHLKEDVGDQNIVFTIWQFQPGSPTKLLAVSSENHSIHFKQDIENNLLFRLYMTLVLAFTFGTITAFLRPIHSIFA